MSNLALYRKYRPSGFDSLIGQEAIKNTLFNALTQNKVSHAYLFSGPRGTGKTSAAKILARALNCIAPSGVEPCGKCDGCKESNPDILEMDAASNNGVDEIRDLREKVSYSPVYGKYKVYIIDEVHMLTTQAFNALLKTLEEPPAHAVFILATTEPHKIPLTILSRCQRFDFRRINEEDIIDRMKHIVNQEQVEVEFEALQLIAQISAGGMRDALSLLDQAISHANDKVTLQNVIDLTGAVDTRKIGKLIQLISAKEIEPALEHFNVCFQSGQEPKFFLEEMMIYYRDILMHSKLGAKASLRKGLTDPAFFEVAAVTQVPEIFHQLQILQDTMSKIKFNNDAQLLVEMAIVEMINGESSYVLIELEKLKKQVATLLTEENSHSFSNIQEEIIPEVTAVKEVEESIVDKKIILVPRLAEKQSAVNLISLEELQAGFVLEEQSNKDKELAEPEIIGEQKFNQISEDREFDALYEKMPGFKEPLTFSLENGSLKAEDIQMDAIQSNESLSQSNAIISNETTPDLKGSSFRKPDEQIDSTPFMALVEEGERSGANWIEVINEPEIEEVEGINELLQPFNSLPSAPLNAGYVEDSRSNENEKLFQLLGSCSKDEKALLVAVYENAMSLLKETKVSTFSLFREFKLHAVSPTHMVFSHTEPIKVKMLEKVTNRSIIEGVFEDAYKPMKLVAITSEEWKQVSDQIRAQKA